MADISTAYQWAINTCNSPTVGYSQTYRAQQTVNGITYYDCSSFIWYALLAGGFDLVTVAGTTYPFTTFNMGSILEALGFTKYDASVEWQKGDILVVNNASHNHTEMCYDGRITMGAHSSAYVLDRQVSINTYETDPSFFQYCYRYSSPVVPSNWIKGNRYLSIDEMKNNAFIIYSTLYAKGWSLNSIAGMLGNMQSESSINPGIWQNLEVVISNGFGLVQWTPSTNYTDWASQNGYASDDGDGQVKWIDEVTASSGQWIETASYPISFADFKVSMDTPENLASAFLFNFERASVTVEETRRTQARYWYDYLKGTSPYIPPVIDTTFKKLPFWMMLKPYL